MEVLRTRYVFMLAINMKGIVYLECTQNFPKK